jgi:hypothetical protein
LHDISEPARVESFGKRCCEHFNRNLLFIVQKSRGNATGTFQEESFVVVKAEQETRPQKTRPEETPEEDRGSHSIKFFRAVLVWFL